MMAASLALPLALFAFASTVSWVSINETADREIERALDVAHEHALKVFETIDNSLVTPAPDIDFSDRDYFKAHVTGDVGTYIGEALKPRPPYQGAGFFGV